QRRRRHCRSDRRSGVCRAVARLCRFPDQAHDAAIGQAESLYAAAAGGGNPARCENAGGEGSIGGRKVLDQKSPTFGYDAQTNEYVDLVQKGIIDPAEVVRTALQDAASVAGLLVTTEAGVAEAPKKKEEHTHMPGGGMGGMDMM